MGCDYLTEHSLDFYIVINNKICYTNESFHHCDTCIEFLPQYQCINYCPNGKAQAVAFSAVNWTILFKAKIV